MQVQYNRQNDSFFVKEKIGKQTFLMEFDLWDYTCDMDYYNIAVSLYTKRKHINYNEDCCLSTGLNPMKTIEVGIKAFELLEERIQQRGTKTMVFCIWTDVKRKKAYYRFLSKRGYKYGRLDNFECIYKIYN